MYAYIGTINYSIDVYVYVKSSFFFFFVWPPKLKVSLKCLKIITSIYVKYTHYFTCMMYQEGPVII